MSLTWDDICASARNRLDNKNCRACVVCDGRACKNSIPGPGAKGLGDVAIRNYNAWRDIRINMDTLAGSATPTTSCELFGRRWSFPLFIAPVGDIQRHYGSALDTITYNRMVLSAARSKGVAAMTGDGVDEQLFIDSCTAIKDAGGIGIPTVKPWNASIVEKRMEYVASSQAFAVAMDVDAAGLPFLKGLEPPAGCMDVATLSHYISLTNKPFVVKGVMSASVARKALRAGASAIVVSNHGGRVLDGCPATAEVLPSIVDEVAHRIPVLVDGGIRSGLDIFRALALGADGVLVCRPFVTAAFGVGEEGIKRLLELYQQELCDVMEMCGIQSITNINRDCLW